MKRLCKTQTPSIRLSWTHRIALALACSLSISAQAAPPTKSLEINVDGGPQDFAFEQGGTWLFVQALQKRKDGEEHQASVINRFRLGANGTKLMDTTGPIMEVGHQGISVEPEINDTFWLWASKQGASGREGIRFKYKANEARPEIETYTLFDERFTPKTVSMPKVCTGAKILIARGQTKPKEQYIRLFDLEALRRGGPGDYSKRFIREWQIPTELMEHGAPIQGIACDQNHVYILSGHAKIDEPKHLYVFTHDGQIARKTDNLNIGMDVALADGKGKAYEPEGVSVHWRGGHSDQAIPFIGVISGGGNRKNFRLWEVGSSAF